ncbi:hypothetical protein C4565_03920 [Candidatus Parcubacteria bacterium]|nr:MAG: hypothetical protein C4565_03920 [Candidatus Parcubacteria bacterium]
MGYGSRNGVFKSNDDGKFWSEAILNLSHGVTVFAVKINPFDGSVHIGTSFGTFRLEKSIVQDFQLL